MFNFSHKYFERMFDSGFIPVLTNNLVDCTYTLALRSTSPRHADWKNLHREARVFFEQMATHCLNYKIPCHNPLAFFTQFMSAETNRNIQMHFQISASYSSMLSQAGKHALEPSWMNPDTCVKYANLRFCPISQCLFLCSIQPFLR